MLLFTFDYFYLFCNGYLVPAAIVLVGALGRIPVLSNAVAVPVAGDRH